MKLSAITNIFSRKTPAHPQKQAQGKHIYPRYLYHLTSSENAHRIITDGVLVATNEGLMKDSIFLFDLENFLKFWNIRPKKYDYKPIKNALLDRVANSSGNISLFRIDTSKINKEFLKIRSQNYIFAQERLDELKKAIQKRGSSDKLTQKEKRRFSHYLYGENANLANLYKQRKESIEYIYPFDILKDAFEKIGETKVYSKTTGSENDTFIILNKLLDNQPEQNAVKVFLQDKL